MKYNLLKKLAVLPAALMLLSFNPAAALADEYTQNADTTVVTEKPSAPGAASSETFTGAVRHQSLFGTTADSTYTGSYVFFPAGGALFLAYPSGRTAPCCNKRRMLDGYGKRRQIHRQSRRHHLVPAGS